MSFADRWSESDKLYGEPAMAVHMVPPFTNELIQGIIKSLCKAICHAERVARREHIKADRLERVNQFVVSLRRMLITLELEVTNLRHNGGLNALVSWLCDKTIWHDIGVLAPNLTPMHNNSLLTTWVMQARRQATIQTEAQAEIIRGDLDELERGLQGILTYVEDARRINEEGEILSHKLCEVFTK